MKALLLVFLAIWPAFAQLVTQYQQSPPNYIRQQQQYPQLQTQQPLMFSQYRTNSMNDGNGNNGAFGQPGYNTPYGQNNYNGINGYTSTPYNQYGYPSVYDANRRQFDANGFYNGVSTTTVVAVLATTVLAFIL